MFFHMVYISG